MVVSPPTASKGAGSKVSRKLDLELELELKNQALCYGDLTTVTPMHVPTRVASCILCWEILLLLHVKKRFFFKSLKLALIFPVLC